MEPDLSELVTLKTQELAALSRIALSLETLVLKQQSSQPTVLGRGFGKRKEEADEMVGAKTIYVGTKAGGFFYVVDERGAQSAYDADFVEASVKNVKLIYKPSRTQNRMSLSESWKLQLMLATDKGGYILEFGASTGFSRCIVEPLLEVNPEALEYRLLIVPKIGDVETSVLANISLDGQQLYVSDRLAGKWSEIWQSPTFELIRRLKELHGLEFPYSTAKDFYWALSNGESVPDSIEATPKTSPRPVTSIPPTTIDRSAPQFDPESQGIIDQFQSQLQAATTQEQVAAIHEWVLKPAQFSPIESFPGISSILGNLLKQAGARVAELPPPVSTSVPTIVTGRLVEKQSLKLFEGEKSSIVFQLETSEGVKKCGARNAQARFLDEVAIGSTLSCVARLPQETEATHGLDLVVLKTEVEVAY